MFILHLFYCILIAIGQFMSVQFGLCSSINAPVVIAHLPVARKQLCREAAGLSPAGLISIGRIPVIIIIVILHN